jgi:UDP-3-O-[3-hydroxymyristoyl] glucosamine N-acyltransferase
VTPMSATLSELADRFGCALHGPAAARVTRVGTLTGADASAVAFLANPLYRSALASTRAGAVILAEHERVHCPVPALVAENPYAAYARVAEFLHPLQTVMPGIHATAAVAPDAVVAPTAEVRAHVSIGSGCNIGDGCLIGAGSVLGANVQVGAHTRLDSRVTLLDDVRIGRRCLLHAGVVIGSDGFGFARDREGWIKVPQVGSVTVGDDVEIGANTTIDRGTIEDTVIGDGVKLDNLIQIAHNVHIGAQTVIAAMSGIAGSTRIGQRCMFGGAVGIAGHVEICDDVMILMRSAVTRSIRKPGTYSSCLPAEEAGHWRRNAARFNQLDRLVRRIRALDPRFMKHLTRKVGKEEDHD